ncbi:MAG: S-adenosylmethionine synthetase [Chlamydiales bacterium]|jgi:S-adenosylmethionine synthetase
MSNFLFTSESVSIGHPDKIADQISDAVLDACLAQDPHAKVACETLVSTGLVVLAGEITTDAIVDYQAVVRETIKKAGYTKSEYGFDFNSCAVLVSLNKQSPDISQGVKEGQGLFGQQGAGDQGMMFGFACDETPELMPLTLMLSHQILAELQRVRENGEIEYLRPDAKSQVTVEYDEDHRPVRVHTVVVSTQHSEEVEYEKLVADVKALVKRVIPEEFIDDETIFYINPTGRFVIGGPTGDCGLTGRKISVDTYGGMARHGGGAFSGKDPSKVDRSAAYAARYVAKNIVAAKLARRCEIQLAYAIGYPEPVSIKVDTFGTGTVKDSVLSDIIPKLFDLSAKGVIRMLDLKRPIYSVTAYGGHFGRENLGLQWEKTDYVQALLTAVEEEIANERNEEDRRPLGAVSKN